MRTSPLRPLRPRRGERGVSLIEALVALAVMAFGMLGVVGMQTTLRYNADMAKQRSEAVRIAQETLEEWRTFSVLAASTGHTRLYSGVASLMQTNVAGYTTNTTYRRTGTVVESVPPGSKTMVVDVEWTDRNGATQNVRLSSLVAGIAPELAATLVTPTTRTPTRNPLGRERSIPLTARNFGDGSSGFMPPQSGGTVAWLFSNTTGVITLCQTTRATNAAIVARSDLFSCAADPHLLASGFVRFATLAVQPTAADIAAPAGPLFPAVKLSVVQTAPVAGTVACFEAPLTAGYVEYFCAVPILTLTPRWAGSLRFDSPPLIIASSSTDPNASAFKVCRDQAAASYTNIESGLLNQNFVVIRAGVAGVAFDCPSGVSFRHQPAI